MDKETNSSTYQYPLTLEALVDDMEKHPDRYKHLQFILNRKKHQRLGMGQRYLLVNCIGFGLYELNSVDCSNCIIKMTLTNPDTGKPSEINLDVCNEHPDIYLINLKDVEDLVYAESNFDCTDDELLEFDFKLSGLMHHFPS